MAFRVEVSVNEIGNAIDDITYIFSKNGGITKMKIAGPMKSDIVQVMYGYLPNIGIIEFQIGHPFAFYTFAVDSKIRHNQKYNIQSDLIDLCTDGFYENVKQKILGNNPDYDIIAHINKIYNDGHIPSQLLEILNTI